MLPAGIEREQDGLQPIAITFMLYWQFNGSCKNRTCVPRFQIEKDNHYPNNPNGATAEIRTLIPALEGLYSTVKVPPQMELSRCDSHARHLLQRQVGLTATLRDYSPDRIRTCVFAFRGQCDWPNYTTGVQFCFR